MQLGLLSDALFLLQGGAPEKTNDFEQAIVKYIFAPASARGSTSVLSLA